jgi:hypothetical protein
VAFGKGLYAKRHEATTRNGKVEAQQVTGTSVTRVRRRAPAGRVLPVTSSLLSDLLSVSNGVLSYPYHGSCSAVTPLEAINVLHNNRYGWMSCLLLLHSHWRRDAALPSGRTSASCQCRIPHGIPVLAFQFRRYHFT